MCGVCLFICSQIVTNLYMFYNKFCFLVFHFHDIDLKLFILFFCEEPQKTKSKYLKNLLFTNPYYMTELLAALSFQTKCFSLSCPSPGCVPLQILFIDFPIESSLHLFYQPRIYFNFFIVIPYHLFPIVFIFSIFLVVCYKAH